MSKIITNADGLTFTEPELVAGLGVDWQNYRPSIDETILNDKLIPALSESKANAEKELAAIRAIEAKKAVARKTLETLKDAAASLAICDIALKNKEANTHAMIQNILNQACELGERGLYAPDLNYRADEEEISHDITFLNDFMAFLKMDNELDKLLYAFHKVDVKYRKKLFKECYRRMVEVLDFIHAAERAKSVIKNATWETTIKDHVKGCRIIYEKLLPGFREMKKRLSKGDLSCLRDDPMMTISNREAEAYTQRMVEHELAQEK